MAITFLEKRKRLKFLIAIAFVLIASSGVIIWQGFLGKPKSSIVFPSPEPVVSGRKIEVDLTVLKSPILETLEQFEGIPVFEGSLGRQNPFSNY